MEHAIVLMKEIKKSLILIAAVCEEMSEENDIDKIKAAISDIRELAVTILHHNSNSNS